MHRLWGLPSREKRKNTDQTNFSADVSFGVRKRTPDATKWRYPVSRSRVAERIEELITKPTQRPQRDTKGKKGCKKARDFGGYELKYFAYWSSKEEIWVDCRLWSLPPRGRMLVCRSVGVNSDRRSELNWDVYPNTKNGSKIRFLVSGLLIRHGDGQKRGKRRTARTGVVLGPGGHGDKDSVRLAVAIFYSYSGCYRWKDNPI